MVSQGVVDREKTPQLVRMSLSETSGGIREHVERLASPTLEVPESQYSAKTNQSLLTCAIMLDPFCYMELSYLSDVKRKWPSGKWNFDAEADIFDGQSKRLGSSDSKL
jgi:hypothetical protein